MRILGISAFYHDSAAALVEDGHIVAAAQEERFSRRKQDARFPENAIRYCLEEGGLTRDELDYVVFYEKPFVKFERLLETYLAFAPRGFTSFRMALPLWLKEKLFQRDLIGRKLKTSASDFDWRHKLLFVEHHHSHAASAFYPSPFEEALILTMDGVGEWATTSIGIGRNHGIETLKEIHFPHSLGLLYAAFTYYTGFKVNSGEYKVMGLAPYGEPRYANEIFENLIDLKSDGSFRLNQEYFDYSVGLRMTSPKFDNLFGGPPRASDAPLEQRHMDLAASVQAVTEEVVLRMVRSAVAETGLRRLCLAGGVALNCVANGKVLRDGVIDHLWVQPASGDAGGALGAALAVHYEFLDRPRRVGNILDGMQGAYLGPAFTNSEIANRLRTAGAVFQIINNEEALIRHTVDALIDERAVGWFQGRMEFGPRALGARSILGDPRSPQMQRQLNLKVKFRESFRPFAPSVLREDVTDWFELDCDSPYMLVVADVREDRRCPVSDEDKRLFGIERLNTIRSLIPAVTHVDMSARVQTVHKETNPRYHALLSEFKARTGCPILVNTSFNIRSEPVVCTPEDAFRCFMGTDIELLVAGNCIARKEDQDPTLRVDYKDTFEPD
jgi:carbamoyltransferase